jgi:hypothetical protein
MQNLHDDKNLDRLSRDAAENFQPDASLHSWEQLKTGLDRELPEKKKKKRRIIFFLFLFMLVGGGLVLSMLWPGDSKTPQQAVITTGGNTSGTTTPAPVDNPQAPAGSADNNVVTSDVVINDVRRNDVPGNDVRRNNVDATNTVAGRKKQQLSGSDKLAAINEPSSNKNQVKLQGNPVIVTDDKTIIDDKIVTNDKVVTGDKKVVTEDKVVAEDKVKTDNTTTDNTTGKSPTEDKPVTAEEKVVTANKTTPKKEEPTVVEDKPATAKAKPTSTSRNPSVAASRWEFGAVYAPDISTVKFSHTQKPGTNVGLTVGYNISRRFSIQAGAIYTIKKYKSRGSDYHPPKGYWTEYVKLETVTADCNMWDIPINLRYNLVPKHRTNLFVSTGLSSYLMSSEDYYYRYYYANNPNPMYRERKYDTNTRHWGAVLNLSIGYERQLSKHFSIQAEPFFKQPLKGVGFGSVKLNSTGIFFSVKYKPVARPRK